MRNSDFRFCKRTRNSKRISSTPPEKSVQEVGFNKWIQIRIFCISFITVLLGTLGKEKKDLLNCSSKQCFLFSCLLCVCLRDSCCWKQFKSFLVCPQTSPRPKKWGIQGQVYQRWNRFSDFSAFDPNFKNPNPNPNPDFPIERVLPHVCLEVYGELPWQRLLLSRYTLAHVLMLNNLRNKISPSPFPHKTPNSLVDAQFLCLETV